MERLEDKGKEEERDTFYEPKGEVKEEKVTIRTAYENERGKGDELRSIVFESGRKVKDGIVAETEVKTVEAEEKVQKEEIRVLYEKERPKQKEENTLITTFRIKTEEAGNKLNEDEVSITTRNESAKGKVEEKGRAYETEEANGKGEEDDTNFVYQIDDIKEKETEKDEEETSKNILLFEISKTNHPISVHVLHTICWPFGRVLRILVFWEGEKICALVEFATAEAAKIAINGLDGRNIYPGCCTLHVVFSKATRLRLSKNNCFSWDYTMPKVEFLLQRTSSKRHPLLEDPLFLPYRPEKDPTHRPALLAEPFPPQRYSVKLVFEEFWY